MSTENAEHQTTLIAEQDEITTRKEDYTHLQMTKITMRINTIAHVFNGIRTKSIINFVLRFDRLNIDWWAPKSSKNTVLTDIGYSGHNKFIITILHTYTSTPVPIGVLFVHNIY